MTTMDWIGAAISLGCGLACIMLGYLSGYRAAIDDMRGKR